MKGIDVSYHNGKIDWKQVKQSMDFAIIRAGYGKSQIDDQFANNISEAYASGLKIGIYWFIYAANKEEATLNAKMCEKCIERYKNIITMRVWADWEYDSDKRNPQTKESRTDIVKTFCNYLSDKGYEVGIYSNIDYIQNKFDDLSEYPLWLARYNSNIDGYHPFMWQYSSKGKVAGVASHVDMNVYYGSLEGFKKKRSTIKLGSRGADVIYLQQQLVLKGYQPGSIDGIFGTKTDKAVRLYQNENNLTADGIVGVKTWGSLY